MNQQTNLKSDTLSTAKFEQRMEQIKNDIQRYRRVEQSAELKEFQDLKKVVETKEFQDNKNYLLHRKYRDTDEYKKMSRYGSLRRSIAVRVYSWAMSSENFRQYIEFAKSGQYAQLQDKEAVAASSELQGYKAIDKSLKAKWYHKSVQSPKVPEYLHLDAEIHTEEFEKSNAFWANPKRWHTTDESKQDARYTELKNTDNIRFYLSQDARQIADWESYKTLFEDECEQMSVWKSGFHYTNKNLKTDHSYYNEQAAYNYGKNAFAAGSILSVETKKENVTASAWHPTKGFITKDFAWTSDVLQTADTFQTTKGLFLAKVRVSGGANAAMYLATGERQPVLKMMQWDGKQVSAGVRTNKDEASITIQNLKAGQWYIYGIQITDKEVVWSVNGQEILRIKNNFGDISFFPAITEFLPEGKTAGAGKIEMDWIRVYDK